MSGGSFGYNQQKGSSDIGIAPGSVPKEFQALRGPFAEAILSLLGFAPTGERTAEGALGGIPSPQGGVAPLGQGERTLLQRLQGEGGARRGYLDEVLSGAYLPGQGQENPYLQPLIEAAQRPTLQGLEETLTRSLPGRFTQAGQFVQPGGSSAFDRAAAIATRGATQEAGDIATRLAAGAYEGERGRQQQAAQLSQQEVDTTISNLQAQALPRLIEQAGVEQGLQIFNQRVNTLLQVLQTIASLPLSPFAAVTTSQSGFGFGADAAQRRG